MEQQQQQEQQVQSQQQKQQSARFLTPQQLHSSAAGEAALRRLYAATLAALPFPFEERWVQTASFGRVHVVVCGPPAGPPLLLWHGATAPAPFMLCAPSLRPLVDRFRVFCPDLPCHAGSRSNPAVLDPSTHAHGRWCLEVMQALGLLPGQSSGGGGGDGIDSGSDEQLHSSSGSSSRDDGSQQEGMHHHRPPLHVGVSLGGTMLLELGCVVAPEAVGAAALVVPGGLLPGGTHPSWRPALGLLVYRLLLLAPLLRLALACLFDRQDECSALVRNIGLAARHLRCYPPSPGPLTDEQLRRLAAPLFLACAEHDVWGADRRSLAHAQAVWPPGQLEAVLLPGAKHVPSQDAMLGVCRSIVRFFEEQRLVG